MHNVIVDHPMRIDTILLVNKYFNEVSQLTSSGTPSMQNPYINPSWLPKPQPETIQKPTQRGHKRPSVEPAASDRSRKSVSAGSIEFQPTPSTRYPPKNYVTLIIIIKYRNDK